MQRLSHHKINSSLIEFDNFNYKKFLWKKFFKTSKIFPISVRTSKVSRSMIQRQFEWLWLKVFEWEKSFRFRYKFNKGMSIFWLFRNFIEDFLYFTIWTPSKMLYFEENQSKMPQKFFFSVWETDSTKNINRFFVKIK